MATQSNMGVDYVVVYRFATTSTCAIREMPFYVNADGMLAQTNRKPKLASSN